MKALIQSLVNRFIKKIGEQEIKDLISFLDQKYQFRSRLVFGRTYFSLKITGADLTIYYSDYPEPRELISKVIDFYIEVIRFKLKRLFTDFQLFERISQSDFTILEKMYDS